MAPTTSTSKRSDDDSFAIIERLAETIRIEDDTKLSSEDRSRLVCDLYEGPRKCECCINWINEVPPDVDLDAVTHEEADDADSKGNRRALVLRRRVTPGEAGASAQVTLHSIDVRSAGARRALCEVFKGLDSIVPDLKFLVFHAPFHPFFWRWDEFEKAIETEEDAEVKLVLRQLRAIVRHELADAFAVARELIPHGVITHKHLWTLFKPGELVFSDMWIDRQAERDDAGRIFHLESAQYVERRHPDYQLNMNYVDWDGWNFGLAMQTYCLLYFRGTKKITDLAVYPARYHADPDKLKARCVERGRKFVSLADLKYMAYREPEEELDTRGAYRNVGIRPAAPLARRPRKDNEKEKDKDKDTSEASNTTAETKKRLDRRIIVDARDFPGRSIMRFLRRGESVADFNVYTDLITQAPVDVTPPGGHRPLPRDRSPRGLYRGDRDYHSRSRSRRRYNPDDDYYAVRSRQRIVVEERRPLPRRERYEEVIRVRPRRGSVSSVSSSGSDSDSDDEDTPPLSDENLQLCTSTVRGFCLREKRWCCFFVDRVVDIEYNTAPFESLVLPDGYKDLILSFVESQVRDGQTFDDVINGKGGGLVILLAGDPGVGKTLTAESVAEKLQAPLYKLELSQMRDPDVVEVTSEHYVPPPGAPHYPPPYRGGPPPPPGDRPRRDEDDIVKAFRLAAKWRAVLLVDECDLYLERRGDDPSAGRRNRIVARFLQELEYYPSLLFLTTNREKVLDPAIYSRIHLTINYPALDGPSRRLIWSTFLAREAASAVTEGELDYLAGIDMNGRRIRNTVQTARIMARKLGRGICFDDIKNVMRITEGLTI